MSIGGHQSPLPKTQTWLTPPTVLEACQLPGQFVPLRFPRSWLIVAEESWTELVVRILRERRGPVSLTDIYAAVRRHPKAQRNTHWRAKVRQSLARARVARTSAATYSSQPS